MTLPELRVALQGEEKTELEKTAKKKGDDSNTARTLRINQEIASRVFDHSLASYKCKDDRIALAANGALALSMDGAVVELVNAIKDHFAEIPVE